MPIMMFFLSASMLLLFAVLVLVSTIYLSKSKHPHNTLSRSHSKKMQIDSAVSGNSSCQTCCLCGGLRLRTPNAAFLDDSKGTKLQSHRLDDVARGQSRPTRYQWAAMKTQVVLSIKQAVQKLISQHKKQAHKDFLTKLAGLSKFSRRKMNPQSKDMHVVPGDLPTSECSSQCSTGSFVDVTFSNAITNGTTTEFDKDVAQDTPKSTNVDPQDAPIHRVVLEILVGNANESSPGLTLKLETSATLEHLAGCVEALKSKDAKNCEHNVDIAHVSCRANDALYKTLGSGRTHGDQASQRFTQILREAILLPKDEMKCSDCVSKLETAGRESILDSILLNKGVLKGPNDCAQCGLMLGDNMECECPKFAKCSALRGQLKFRSSDHLHENAASVVAMEPAIEAKEGSEMASGVSLNTLGSLHISFSKTNEQEDADVSSHAGSMLASLNVTEKLIGGIGANNTKKEKFNNKLCMLSDTSYSSKSDLVGGPDAESVCRENLVKEEEHCPLQTSEDTLSKDGFSSPSKKSKKKKKNKGKKSKVNTESLVADAKEMQEIGKIALEAAKHVSAVPERELGCVCGGLKGNLHNESCPYPFTSSGSMLQRKMREQYNHLVRSNAAKTLTLTQVGQFTSCLVEAKATLRQKSESIQRKFTIVKSLLSKADKSSFDRLCGQIYGLEMEQKKLEEDTVVYNRLQEQLKLSPAYQKMLEYGRAHFELQPNTGQMIEKLEPEDSEMSFEEFLAQEKKDAFWQRHNLARSVPAS